jgi:hypothetical protein
MPFRYVFCKTIVLVFDVPVEHLKFGDEDGNLTVRY